MSSMLGELAGALGGPMLGNLAGALGGADNDLLGKGVAAALPALLGGITHNTRQEGGAQALSNALGRHDGSILDSLGSIFGGGDNAWAQQQVNRDGEKILGHVFGQNRPQVEQQVAASSGLSSGIVSKLLPMLAPIVMGYIGKKIAGGGQQQIAESLQQERAAVQQNDGVFGSILDMLDGDDDQGGGGMMDMAGDLLGGPAGKMILGKLLGG